tara:strand:- start:329 stop:592 length:264 start_codon:yes stop_codon:yes gene_type:complete
MFICFFCNKSINSYQNLYFGNDAVCCSNICRNEILRINKIRDPNMRNPTLWYRPTNYIEKLILENTPKRSHSLIDLINNIKSIKLNQ